IGLDFDNHATEDPRSPVSDGVLLPGNIRSYPVKGSTLQDDRLAAVIAQQRAAVGSHGCQGTNWRLAMTCGGLGDLIGIGRLHLELVGFLEIGLVCFSSLGVVLHFYRRRLRLLFHLSFRSTSDTLQTSIDERHAELRANLIDLPKVCLLNHG